jgi:putative ABC transport system ATP-binding protein
VNPGEILGLIGPNGAGKSTLLNLMGCLDTPTSGDIYISGTRVSDMSDMELTSLRRDRIGFIFQYFNLFPLLNTLENVTFPMMLRTGKAGDPEKAREMLRSVNLEESLYTHTPSELSGGQQQRVAIARALSTKPAMILADEPTANLDTTNGKQVMQIITRLNQETGITFVFATHDPRVIQYARRIITLHDGLVESNGKVEKPAAGV